MSNTPLTDAATKWMWNSEDATGRTQVVNAEVCREFERRVAELKAERAEPLPPGITKIGKCFHNPDGRWTVAGWQFDAFDRPAEITNDSFFGFRYEELERIAANKHHYEERDLAASRARIAELEARQESAGRDIDSLLADLDKERTRIAELEAQSQTVTITCPNCGYSKETIYIGPKIQL